MVKKTFHLDPELWSMFKTVAKNNGYSLSGAVSLMMKRFIKEKEAANEY